MTVTATVYLTSGGTTVACGDSTATMGGGGRRRTNALEDHAERKAWREAWPELRRRVGMLGATTAYSVTITVDATVCADCQKWMLVHAVRHLGQLGRPFTLYAEVPPEAPQPVTRDAVWNVKVGQCKLWKAHPFDLGTGSVKRQDVISMTAS